MSLTVCVWRQLREYTRDLRHLVEKGAAEADIEAAIADQMTHVHRIVSICLGMPPATFTWEYYDKNKAYHKVGPVSPLEFYEKHVKSHFNASDLVSCRRGGRGAEGGRAARYSAV